MTVEKVFEKGKISLYMQKENEPNKYEVVSIDVLEIIALCLDQDCFTKDELIKEIENLNQEDYIV